MNTKTRPAKGGFHLPGDQFRAPTPGSALEKQLKENPMKKLRKLASVLAMLSMAAVLTGCGDDDDNDDNGDVPPPGGPQQFAPLDEAALTAQNKIYTVNVAGQEEIRLTFPAAGQYQLVQGGSTEQGAISLATRDVNRWTMTLTPNEGQDGPRAGIVQFDFTASNAGTWTFTPTGGQAETGIFTVASGPGSGDDGGDNGGGGGREDLTGQTLLLTFEGGGQERFDFTSTSDVIYEPTGFNIPGTYTWDQANAKLNVTLNDGQLFEITIPEGTDQATVNWRQDATSEPAIDPAEYTLQ